MESINEIINHQTFSQDLVEDATEFITVRHRPEQQSQSHHQQQEATNDPSQDMGMSIQTMISCPRMEVSSGERKLRSGSVSGSDSVVMVLGSMDHSNMQTSYEIVPQQLQSRTMTLPFGLLQQDRHSTQEERIVHSSPVDFVSSDISLDGLTVDTMSQAVLPQEMMIKQEQKLLLAQSKILNKNHKRIQMHVDVTSVNSDIRADVDELDNISSDEIGCEDEGVTLNQHHQQLLRHQQQYGLTSHHQHHQAHAQGLHDLQHRSVQLEMGLEEVHGEILSVIVHGQDSDKDLDGEVVADGDGDEEGEVEDEDDDLRDSRSRDQLLSSYQTLTSVNDRLSPPGFSQTSYATLTPIQPLPPISTMSEKFAYSGHISGGDSRDTDVNGGERGGRAVESSDIGNQSAEAVTTSSITSGNVSSSGCSNNDCSSFSTLTMPIGSGHLGMGVLGSVQSPYSSYEKLSAMISPPPNNYLVSCDLHASVSGRVRNSSQLNLSHNGHKKDSASAHGHAQGHCDGNTGKFSYSGHISGGDSGDTDVNGEKFTYSEHISGGDSRDADVNREKFVYSEHISGRDSGSEANARTNWIQMAPEREVRLHMSPELDERFHLPSERRTRLNVPSERGPLSRQVAATTPNCPPDWKADDWKPDNRSIVGLSTDLPEVVSLTPTPPPITDDTVGGLKLNDRLSPGHRSQYFLDKSQETITVTIDQCSTNIQGSALSVCAIHQESQPIHLNGFQGGGQQVKTVVSASPKAPAASGGAGSSRSGNSSDMEEINTKDLAQRISAELKRYSIPQAIFAQRVLCRSQGTLSDLLRNPKPWSKLKSGRETFRRMFKWLQEPEFQRMSALRMAAAQIPQRAPLGSGIGLGSATGSNSSATAMSTDLDSHGGSTTTPKVGFYNIFYFA
ncbi:homeobox protein onecut isoform X2 [Drosophila eugracilis]|uniref:homeobox protein onecut isoform X2 n=1 Tax=Drosophila eugracilis TaxID=29029 RepID=UPI0007E5EA88|nr:homeobox protein onecut isoform X2 [Drosophila eugracilis]